MRWTERQRAMLREIGIPPFWPEERAEVTAAVDAARGAAEPALTAAWAEPKTQGDHPAQAEQFAPSSPANSPAAGVAPAPGAPSRAPSRVSAPSRVTGSTAQPASKPSTAEIALGPRPSGIETMDWSALRDTVMGCQACSLCQSRTQAVFGVGNERARWMIVGEAPGEQEDRQGEPFVGRAGQLLDRMLAALDLTRAEADADRQVFIANVLKCRPPANRNPLPQEVAQCEPYLMRQVALVQPKVILAMGRFAVQSLLKSSEPIGRLRGKVHEVAGVPVVVTYHPAYLLRSPGDKALAWDDLCLAREAMAQSPR